MASPTASVVICAYTERRWPDILAAVHSALYQSRPALEVILVVDHHEDLLARIRAEMPGVVAVPNDGHRGLSGARNSGVARARGDVVAFLDDDAEAAPEWLEHLLAAYADPDVAGVGGAIEPLWATGRPRSFPHEFDWVVGCTYRGMPETASPVRNLIGANMSFRRELLREIGGFHSGLGRIGTRPLGCEETELCLRVHRRWPSVRFLYEPAAHVRHKVPEARARWAYFRARCYAEGLSKAMVVRLAGKQRGLAAERSYALSTLPRGVARGVGDGLRRGDPAGLARAAGIATGLVVTTAGYLVGMTLGMNAASPTNPSDSRRNS